MKFSGELPPGCCHSRESDEGMHILGQDATDPVQLRNILEGRKLPTGADPVASRKKTAEFLTTRCQSNFSRTPRKEKTHIRLDWSYQRPDCPKERQCVRDKHNSKSAQGCGRDRRGSRYEDSGFTINSSRSYDNLYIGGEGRLERSH